MPPLQLPRSASNTLTTNAALNVAARLPTVLRHRLSDGLPGCPLRDWLALANEEAQLLEVETVLC